MSRSPDHLHNGQLHAELVASLLRTLPPALIMTGLFLITGLLAFQASGMPVFLILSGIGGCLSLARIAIILHGRSLAAFALSVEDAPALERRFAWVYVPFAALVGLLAAEIFVTFHAELRIIAAVMIVGYAAGVGAGIYVRPWICVPSILAAVLPLTILAGVSPNGYERFLAVSLLAFTAGGIESSLSRYRSEVEKISQRQRLATLSRLDDLTGLPNQLALLEAVDAAIAAGQRIWLHLAEIRGVGLVNDRAGHSAGNEVLRHLASHLSRGIAGTALIGRLGGGSFGLIQPEHFSSTGSGQFSETLVADLRSFMEAQDPEMPLEAYVACLPNDDHADGKSLLLSLREAPRRSVR